MITDMPGRDFTFDSFEALVRAVKDRADDLDSICVIVDPKPVRAGGVISTPSGVVVWCTGKTFVSQESIERILNDPNIRKLSVPFRLLRAEEVLDL
jgi:hypothetical protein